MDLNSLLTGSNKPKQDLDQEMVQTSKKDSVVKNLHNKQIRRLQRNETSKVSLLAIPARIISKLGWNKGSYISLELIDNNQVILKEEFT